MLRYLSVPTFSSSVDKIFFLLISSSIKQSSIPPCYEWYVNHLIRHVSSIILTKLSEYQATCLSLFLSLASNPNSLFCIGAQLGPMAPNPYCRLLYPLPACYPYSMFWPTLWPMLWAMLCSPLSLFCLLLAVLSSIQKSEDVESNKLSF